MATCVEVSGAKYPAEANGEAIQPMEGRSLVTTFSGGALEREGMYWEHEGNRAVLTQDWKLVARGWKGGLGTLQHGCRPHGNQQPCGGESGPGNTACRHRDALPIVPRIRPGSLPAPEAPGADEFSAVTANIGQTQVIPQYQDDVWLALPRRRAEKRSVRTQPRRASGNGGHTRDASRLEKLSS